MNEFLKNERMITLESFFYHIKPMNPVIKKNIPLARRYKMAPLIKSKDSKTLVRSCKRNPQIFEIRMRQNH